MANKRSVQELLHSAYSAVRASETTKSIAALTLDHLIEEQIASIRGGTPLNILDSAGKPVSVRVSKLAALTTIELDIDAVVKAAQTEVDV